MNFPSTMLEMTPWNLARSLLSEHLKRGGGRLVQLYRVGSHGARASICLHTGVYEVIEANVSRELTSRTAIDGALAFVLLWEADWEQANGRGRLHQGKLSRTAGEP